MLDRLKALGGIAFGLIGILVPIALATLLFDKTDWLSDKALPFLKEAASIGFYIVLLVLIPLSFIRKLRPATSTLIILSSYLFGVTTWLWSALVTYNLWGGLALTIGLFIMGIGVLPIAILATMFKGMWMLTLSLVLMLAITYGARMVGGYISTKT